MRQHSRRKPAPSCAQRQHLSRQILLHCHSNTRPEPADPVYIAMGPLLPRTATQVSGFPVHPDAAYGGSAQGQHGHGTVVGPTGSWREQTKWRWIYFAEISDFYYKITRIRPLSQRFKVSNPLYLWQKCGLSANNYPFGLIFSHIVYVKIENKSELKRWKIFVPTVSFCNSS